MNGGWERFAHDLPSGKHTKNYGKSQFSMGKSTIFMAMFNSYVSLPEGNVIPEELHRPPSTGVGR